MTRAVFELMPARVLSGVITLVFVPVVHAADENVASDTARLIQIAGASLEHAQNGQAGLLDSLRTLLQGRQQTVGLAELLSSLAAVRDMQSAARRSTAVLSARCFGKRAQDFNEPDRRLLQRVMTDQATTRRRFSDWREEADRRLDAGESATEPVARLVSVISAWPIGATLAEAYQHLEQVRLAQAGEAQSKALEQINRLLSALEAAITSPDELARKRITQLQGLLDREKAIHAELQANPLSDEHAIRLLQAQVAVAEGALRLTYPEAGLAPDTIEHVRQAYRAMQKASDALRDRNKAEALEQTRVAIENLEVAIRASESFVSEAAAEPLPWVPQKYRRKKSKQTAGMPAIFGRGKTGSDNSAVAQVANDIALIAKIKIRQRKLYRETVGLASRGDLLAGRQESYAAALPPVIRRVEMYHEQAIGDLTSAHQAMVQSAEQLRREDDGASARNQEMAINHLGRAEELLRQFWKELMEAFAKLADTSAVGSIAAGAPLPNEKVQMARVLMLLRELVRLSDILRDQEDLLERTQARQALANNDRKDAKDLADEQRELAARCEASAHMLTDISAEEAPDLDAAVWDSAQIMRQAVGALDAAKLPDAIERQEAAIEHLYGVWKVVAKTMGSESEGQESAQRDPDEKEGQAKEPGEQGTAGGAPEKDGGQSWYVVLPPRAREAVKQSLAEPFPARYEQAIKLYYKRLSRGTRGE